jgi:hypothetical protein
MRGHVFVWDTLHLRWYQCLLCLWQDAWLMNDWASRRYCYLDNHTIQQVQVDHNSWASIVLSGPVFQPHSLLPTKHSSYMFQTYFHSRFRFLSIDMRFQCCLFVAVF